MNVCIYSVCVVVSVIASQEDMIDDVPINTIITKRMEYVSAVQALKEFSLTVKKQKFDSD